LSAGAVAWPGGNLGGQVGRSGLVAAVRAGRVRGEVVAGGSQFDGEGDFVGVDAEVDGGGHGLVDEGVVEGEQAPSPPARRPPTPGR
jgi:hypothetical protein